MIDRSDILAEMGRKRISVSELARRAGIHVNAARSFLNGGDTKLSTLTAILADRKSVV